MAPVEVVMPSSWLDKQVQGKKDLSVQLCVRAGNSRSKPGRGGPPFPPERHLRVEYHKGSTWSRSQWLQRRLQVDQRHRPQKPEQKQRLQYRRHVAARHQRRQPVGTLVSPERCVLRRTLWGHKLAPFSPLSRRFKEGLALFMGPVMHLTAQGPVRYCITIFPRRCRPTLTRDSP